MIPAKWHPCSQSGGQDSSAMLRPARPATTNGRRLDELLLAAPLWRLPVTGEPFEDVVVGDVVDLILAGRVPPSQRREGSRV
jgi:hypothetical protein